MCVFILLYMNMPDYNRFSSHKNLIRILDFYRLDDLCASREFFYSEELNLNFIPVWKFCFWKSNWIEIAIVEKFLRATVPGVARGVMKVPKGHRSHGSQDSAPLIHHANNKLPNHPSLIRRDLIRSSCPRVFCRMVVLKNSEISKYKIRGQFWEKLL